MNKKISDALDLLKKDNLVFLNFLKTKFPLFHNSNLFFRDFHYGIKKFLENKQLKISYEESEIIALKFKLFFEEAGIFIPVNDQGWKINYPEFVTTIPGDPL